MSENNIYLFDLDGTLTPPRSKMSDSFAKVFNKFLDKNVCYIVSGSDYCKIKEQVPNSMIRKFSGIYSSMGNELFIDNIKVYSNELKPDNLMLKGLEGLRDKSKYPHERYSNYIEIRKGMINFTTLGRDCSSEARKKYYSWDLVYKERQSICKKLKSLYPEYDISVGGEISIDIVPLGYGKEQVIKHLRKTYLMDKIIFAGDKTQKGGNDHTIALECMKDSNAEVITVKGPDDLCNKLNLT